ncbi:hypothetical protein Bca4012_036447 [Brassica carinata]
MFSRLSLTLWPLKPAKLVRLKAATTRSCDGNESNRKFRKFPTSKWTDRFHSVRVDATEMDALRREMDTLKPNVRKTLMSSQGINSMKKRILMIYLLVSLGLAYHFENEIEESLKEGFEKIEEMMDGEDDLYTTSIIFWVFRTYGHDISSNIFQKFKGNNGMYEKRLSGDAKSLLALYEAAHLGTTTDYIMDEALSFASTHLELLASDATCPPHLSLHIRSALTLSQHRNMEIVVAVDYIPFYEQEQNHDKMLLRFAKLNFNLLQRYYIEELKTVTKWYKEHDFASNVPPFFRNVIVENHFFVSSTYFEPKFAQKRIMLTKYLVTLAILDDTFDRYASLPEAESLPNSLERWAPDDDMDRQPNYLKFVFKFIVDCFEEFEREMMLEGNSYCVEATKKEFNISVKANHDLAKYSQTGIVLGFEEYMEVGQLEIADDMSRGYVPNAVNCYMKQYGVTKLEAIRDLQKEVASCDKIINDECLKNIDVPLQNRNLAFKILRMINVSYNEGEGYTFTKGKVDEYIASLFVNPICL